MSDLRKYIKYLPAQGSVGCCTASASLLAAEIIMSMSEKPMHFSRLFVYYMARMMQGRTGQVGTELGVTLQALKTHGVCIEQLWPFSHQRVNKEPVLTAVQAAFQHRVMEYESVDADNFNSLLDQEIPIIIGLRTGRKFMSMGNTLSNQVYKPINMTDNRPAHGHAVTIVGYDNELCGGSWIIANSLGLKWGDKGFGIIPFGCYVDIGEAYVIRNFAGIPSGKKFQRIDK